MTAIRKPDPIPPSYPCLIAMEDQTGVYVNEDTPGMPTFVARFEHRGYAQFFCDMANKNLREKPARARWEVDGNFVIKSTLDDGCLYVLDPKRRQAICDLLNEWERKQGPYHGTGYRCDKCGMLAIKE